MNYIKGIFLLIFFIFSCEVKRDNTNINFTYLALGDSYTIGEGTTPESSFPEIITNQVPLIDSLLIIAKTGWTTDELLDSLNHLNFGKYDVVSLLIGVNNQYDGYRIDDYAIEFESLLKKAINYSKSKKNVFVLSIPDYGVTPVGKSIGQDKIFKEINSYNYINRLISEKYNIMYFDITGISREAESDYSLLSDDKLHPSEKMYKLWVEKLKYQLMDSLNKI